MGINPLTATVEHSTYYCYTLVPTRNMRLCLILIIAISVLSTKAAPNKDKQELSGSDNQGFENGYFGYGYGGGRGGGTRRYGAYGPAYGHGYGAYGYGANGNRQLQSDFSPQARAMCCFVCPFCPCKKFVVIIPCHCRNSMTLTPCH